MKINILRTILIIMLLWTCCLIFGFSSQNAEKSGGVSGNVTKWLLEKGNNEKALKNKNIVLKTEKVIRKIAHFTIYAIVGFLLMSFMNTFSLSEKDNIRISLGFGILYATSDEVHQLFVPGRSGQITDVILDTTGVLLGILLAIAVVKAYMRIKKLKKGDITYDNR